jgi:hypothetical protein
MELFPPEAAAESGGLNANLKGVQFARLEGSLEGSSAVGESATVFV